MFVACLPAFAACLPAFAAVPSHARCVSSIAANNVRFVMTAELPPQGYIYIYILLHLYEPNTPPLAYVYINMESGHGHGRPTFGRSGSSGVLPASRLSWAATMSSPRWGSPV